MATIRDVAKAAGVSIASVSAVMNASGRVGDDARRRVWAAVREVGYSPNIVARNLRLGRSQLIGVVVGDITNPFSAGLVRVVEKAVIEQGYSVIVSNIDGDDARVPSIIEQLCNQHVAGILLTPAGRSETLIRQLEGRQAPPIVTIDQKLPGFGRDYVGIDNRAAIRTLVQYLVGLGHERIAFIGGQVGLWTADERYEGFVEASTEAGLPVDPSLIARVGYRGDNAYVAVGAIMASSRRPSAIVGANNVIALGSLQACIDLGFNCPSDVSIVGMDDVPWSGLVRPKLTIMTQPIEAMGSVAIGWLLQRMEEPRTMLAPREKIFKPMFAEGDSCREIRRSR